jgi:hypothetical protein
MLDYLLQSRGYFEHVDVKRSMLVAELRPAFLVDFFCAGPGNSGAESDE